jgi:hypothetical protein
VEFLLSPTCGVFLGCRPAAWGDDVGVSRRGWVVWILVGCVVAAVGGVAAWVDLESADKISSVVGGMCGALGLVLSAYGLVRAGNRCPCGLPRCGLIPQTRVVWGMRSVSRR